MEANALTGDDTVVLRAGTYELSLAGTGEDFAATGDLDIRSVITITGAGASQVAIDGGLLDRVFEVTGTGNLTLGGVTITGGRLTGTATGGGIRNAGTLTVTSSVISGNVAAYDGGGLANTKSATLTDTTVSGNTGRIGGGVFSQNDSQTILTISGGTFENNTATAF